MAYIMAHVDEICFFGSNASRGLHGTSDCEVGLVGIVSKGIDDQHFDITCRLLGFWRNVCTIGVVGQKWATIFFENIAICHHAAMGQVNGFDIQPPNGKWSFYADGIWPDVIRKLCGTIEGVLENARQIGQRSFRAINGNAFILHLTKAAKVIEAQNMVHVRVGIKNRIHPINALPEALKAEVRRRIDNE